MKKIARIINTVLDRLANLKGNLPHLFEPTQRRMSLLSLGMDKAMMENSILRIVADINSTMLDEMPVVVFITMDKWDGVDTGNDSINVLITEGLKSGAIIARTVPVWNDDCRTIELPLICANTSAAKQMMKKVREPAFIEAAGVTEVRFL